MNQQYQQGHTSSHYEHQNPSNVSPWEQATTDPYAFPPAGGKGGKGGFGSSHTMAMGKGHGWPAQPFHPATSSEHHPTGKSLATCSALLSNQPQSGENERIRIPLRITHMPWSFTEADVAEFFKGAGMDVTEKNVVMLQNPLSSQPSGEAVVHFTEAQFNLALNLNNAKIDGRKMKVELISNVDAKKLCDERGTKSLVEYARVLFAEQLECQSLRGSPR